MLTTQISGPTPNNKSLFATKYKLKKAGIKVSHPMSNGYIVFIGNYYTFNPQHWRKYEVELDFYNSIITSNLHIVCNEFATHDGLLDYDTCLGIMQAMAYNKPIVMLHPPKFSNVTNLFMQETISRRLEKIAIINLQNLNLLDITQQLNKLPKTVDYQLTTTERALIKLRIKEHFRFLLQPAKRPRATRLFVTNCRVAPTAQIKV